MGSCMFHASNGTTTTSMFGSRLTDMLLDATHLRPTGGMIPAVVRADAWQGTYVAIATNCIPFVVCQMVGTMRLGSRLSRQAQDGKMEI